MNLDDLMAVWRSQDAAPLHDVNQTLLHLALRQEEAKLQKQRRRGRWILYLFSAGTGIGMAFLLGAMIYAMIHRPERNGLTGWDLVLPAIAAVAALLSGHAAYVNHRAQTLREQRFGDSLRDQLNRSIAQVDAQVTEARRTSVLVMVLMGGVCPAAILIAGWRINQKSISDDGYMLVSVLILTAWMMGHGIWQLRRSVEKEILPRRRRLEALLADLGSQ